MSVSDAGRTQSFNTIREKLGPEVAAAIMDLTNPAGWTDVARTSDVEAVAQRLAGVEQRLDHVDHRLDGIERRLDGHDRRFDRIDDRMDSFEAALREQTRFFAATLAGTMAAMTAVIGLIVHL